jgi:hypothetical protein
MKRSVFLLAITWVAALGQQAPAPQPEAWRLAALKNALRGPYIKLLQMTPPPKACAVPLLPAPIDPHAGKKMPITKPPARNTDVMPSAKGLPPCPGE